jgi:hypothetical protein
MAATVPSPKSLTWRDFARLDDRESLRGHELVDGLIEEGEVPSRKHGRIVSRLVAILLPWLDQNGGGELLSQEGEHDCVPLQGSAVGPVQPPPQRPLLDEPELPRDRQARLVRRVDADLDAVDPADLDRHTRQRRARLARQPLSHPARPQPVADLDSTLPDPRVQAGAAHHLGSVRREHRVDEVLAEVELSTKGA